jgi:hypothetical protein
MKIPSDSADRPALNTDEIEVTPEMIEAGTAEFCGYDPRFEGPEDVVPEIYRAMARLTKAP